MKKRVCVVLLAIASILGFLSIAHAKSGYTTQFNTKYGTAGTALDTCTICHPSVPQTNSFGADFASKTIPGHTALAFDAALEARDSDGDGFTNIAEINAKTFPGNSSSHPAGSDTTPPTVTGFSIPATSNSLTVSITTFTATDNVAVTGYKATESATAPSASASGWSASAPSSYTFATAGAKTLYGWAKDGTGNVSASRSASTTITLSDTTPPSVTGFSIPATSTSLTVSITSFTATDNTAVTGYKATESATAPSATASGWTASAPSSYTYSTAGAKTLYGWAKDGAGNVSGSRSASTTITVSDTAPPTANLSTGSFITPRKVSINLTATDDVGGSGVKAYMVKLNAATPSKSSPQWKLVAPTAFIFPTTATTGPKTLYVWAKDKAGNISAPVSLLVNLDVSKPTVTAFTAEATSPASGTVNVSITATDPVVNGVASGVTAYMVTKSNLTPPLRTSAKWVSGPPPTSVTFPTPVKTGTTLYAWVKDANGNVSKAKGAKVTAASAAAAAVSQAQPVAGPAVYGNRAASQASQPATQVDSADMAIWIGRWFKVVMRNEGYYGGQSGFTNDRQNIPGYLKIWDWDPTRQAFQCDFYQQNDQTGEWSSTSLELQYTGGESLDFKASSVVIGDFTYGFTARIQGTQTSGTLTGATFRTLGGYHVQEAAEGDTMRQWAGWLVITGKMVSESEVQVPADTLEH
jgi:hypothetical protein